MHGAWHNHGGWGARVRRRNPRPLRLALLTVAVVVFSAAPPICRSLSLSLRLHCMIACVAWFATDPEWPIAERRAAAAAASSAGLLGSALSAIPPDVGDTGGWTKHKWICRSTHSSMITLKTTARMQRLLV